MTVNVLHDQQDSVGLTGATAPRKATRVPQLVPEHPCEGYFGCEASEFALRRSAAEISWAGPEKKDS